MQPKEGVIYTPFDHWTTEQEQKVLQYYQHQYTLEEIKGFLYGGKPLPALVTEVKVSIENKLERIITFTLVTQFGEVVLSNLSFRQLLVESSYRYGDHASRRIADWQNDGWEQLSPQQRVEVCQNELSRWSVIVIDKNKSDWVDGIPDEINAQNARWIEYLEIVNNCTTTKGFELKLKYKGTLYHGSFIIPQQEYKELCTIQSGSWAWQGWDYFTEDQGIHPTLIKPRDAFSTTNPTFGSIYNAEDKANEKILIDLSVYREIETGSEVMYPITVNPGAIDYTRWGTHTEYYTKPHSRKLVAAMHEDVYTTPPETYTQVQSPANAKGTFRLPLFQENGLYNVLQLSPKTNYHFLSTITKAVLSRTLEGLAELRLVCEHPPSDTALHEIVIGNIDIEAEALQNGFLTMDRFCFHPRKTTSYYDHGWLPAAERYGAHKKAVYAFFLGAARGYQSDAGWLKGQIFIQPESWGIERAILSRKGNKLTLDLMSYERIVPVWQGSIDLEDDTGVV